MNPRIYENPREIGKDTFGSTYLLRWSILRIPVLGWELMLHVFLRSDHSACPHDHPAWFWSFIVAGHYDEDIYLSPELGAISKPGGVQRMVVRNHRSWGSLAYSSAFHTHRVIAEHPVVTIVLIGKPSRIWGYWNRLGKWADWREHRGDDREEHMC